MTEQERFIVSIDNKNSVGLYDGDIRLLYFQFNNIQDATECKDALKHQCSLMNELHEENEELKRENEELKQEKKKILDTINNKITEKGMNWYRAEDNSKEEKDANLQLKVLEEVKVEIIKTMEDAKDD